MAKLNRRDYLKQMAITTAAIAGSGLDIFAQHPRRKILPHEIRPGEEVEIASFDPLKEYFKGWPPAAARPANPQILVTFDGLIDFYYNRDGSYAKTCGVGFQRADGHHRPTVEVLRNAQTYWAERQIDNNSEVILRVVNSMNPDPNVNYFMSDSASPSPYDFRWTIDMQSDPWYPNSRTKGNYSARMFVRNGTFFTQEHTRYNLDQAIKVETLGIAYLRTAELGKPAKVIADEIKLVDTEYVLLNVNGEAKELRQDGYKYEVKFKNLCDPTSGGDHCDFDWKHFQEVKRNDFHHHRDALDLPKFSLKYSVVIAPNEISAKSFRQSRDRRRVSNDAAPCMGAGYGGGNGPS
jgi:hypothetical protein